MSYLASMIDTFKEQFKCDVVRISVVDDKMYLIIGWNRNTKDDLGQWYQVEDNGEMLARDWDYIQEQVIASGCTVKDLIKSANEYERLSGISMEDYLKELCIESRQT